MEELARTASTGVRHAFLEGGGEVGKLIRAFDWGKSPLGDPFGWPQSLKTSVSICINNDFPMLVCWGPEWVMIYNDAYVPVLGAKHPHALGIPLLECWSEIRHMLEPMFQGVMQTGKAIFAEDLMFPLSRNGYTEECYFTFSYSPIKDESDTVGGVLVTCSETTDRVINERRLKTLRVFADRAAEVKDLQQAFDAIHLTLSENDCDFPYAFYYHLEEDDTVSLRASVRVGSNKLLSGFSIVDPDFGEFPLAKLMMSGRPALVNGGFLNQRFGGGAWAEPSQAHYLIAVRRPEKERAYGWLVLGISPRKKFDSNYRDFYHLVADQAATAIANALAFEAERRRTEALMEIDRAKTVFFSNISHEFRTPITLMLTPLQEILERPDGIPEEVKENLTIAHRNSLRLLKLVNALLDFSRIEAGRMQATFEPTDLAELTRDLAGSFRAAIEKAGLELVVDCKQTREPVYVDRSMWEKIVLNLISNAFKYTLEGSINVRLRTKRNQVELQVADTGIGIAITEQQKIFERFHRVPTDKGRSQEGSGIGLSLVQQLVKLHGGEVRVKSRPGKGSIFSVTLPLGKMHLPAEKIKHSGAPSNGEMQANLYVEEALRWLSNPDDLVQLPEPGSREERPEILVADDNADMREYMEHLLSSRYRVHTVRDGRAVLRALKTISPEVIISDIMMPQMDGIELLKALRSNPDTSAIPVILLSAKAGEHSMVEGLQTGADDYLVKPFSARELVARIDTQIKISRKKAHALQSVYKLFNQVPFAVAVLKGKDLIVEYVNSYTLDLWQKKAGEVVGKPMFEVVPATRAGVQKIHDEVYRTGRSVVITETPLQITNDDGSEIRYFNVTVDPMFDEDGRLIGQLATTIEVTDHVRARQKIEQSEKQFRTILSDSPGIFLVLKGFPEMIIEFANEPLFRAWGRGPEIIGKPLLEVLPEIRDQPFPKLLEEVFRTGKPYYSGEEKAVLVKNGVPTDTYFVYVYQPILNDTGEVTGITVMANDVTDQVTQRVALEKREREFREFVSKSPMSIMIVNASGMTIDLVNEKFLIFSGMREEQLVGRPVDDVFPMMQKTGLQKEMQKVIRTGKAFHKIEHEVDMKPYGGKGKQYLDFVYQPLRDDEGKVTRVMVMTHEVTDLVEARKRIEENEQQLQQLFRQAPVAIVVYRSPEFKVEFANDQALSLWGRRLSDVTKRKALEGLPGALSAGDKTILDTLRKGEVYSVSEQQFSFERDGQPYTGWYSYSYEPLRDGLGRLTGVLAVTHEVTEQVLARKKIEESEERFRLATEATGAGIIDFDLRSEQLYWSERMKKLCGYKAGEVITTAKAAIVVHPEDREALLAASIAARNPESDGKLVCEHRIVRQNDGQVRWVHVRAQTYFDEIDGRRKPVRVSGIVIDITQQKEAEIASAQLSAIVESSVDAIYSYDFDGTILSWNRSAEMLYGYAASEILGRNISLILPQERANEATDKIIPAIKSGGSLKNVETVRVRRDGTPVPVLIAASPIRDKGGKPIALSIVARDITEHNNLLSETRAARDQLEQTLVNIPAGVFLLNAHGELIFVNEIAAEMSGFDSAEEMLAQDTGMTREKIAAAFEITDEEGTNIASDQTPAAKTLRTGNPEQQILKITDRSDRSFYWVLCRSTPLFDESGQMRHVLVVSTDITQHKLAEQRVRDSEMYFRNLADTAPVTIWITEKDGSCSYLSRQWYEITGQTEQEALGFGWLEAVHPDDRRNASEIFISANEKHTPFRLTYRLRYQSGDYRWVADSGSPRLDSEGRFQGFIGSVVDVHDRILGEEKVRESENRYRHMFENSPIPTWDEDFSMVKRRIDELKAQGVKDFDKYLRENRDVLLELISLIVVKNVNEAAVKLYGGTKEDLLAGLKDYFVEDTLPTFIEEFRLIAEGGGRLETETVVRNIRGERLNILGRIDFPKNDDYSSVQVIIIDVTDQKRAEDLVRQSQERFRFLFESNILPVAFWKVDGEVYDANDAFLQLLGYNREDMKNGLVNWRKFTVPEDGPLHEASVRRALQGEAVAPYETAYFNKKGERLAALVGYAMLAGSQDKGIAFIQDISRLKEVQHQLRQSEERFRHLSETLEAQVRERTTELDEKNRQLREAQRIAQLGSWEWDLVTGAVQWSDEMYEIYGYGDRHSPVTFEIALERMDPSDAARSRERVREHLVNARKLFERNGSREFESTASQFRLRLPEGVDKIVRAMVKVLMDEEGKPVKMIGTLQDITEQKNAEEQLVRANLELNERNQFVEKLINSSLDLVLVMDRDLRFITLNNQARQLISRYYEGEVIGKSIVELNPEIKDTQMMTDLMAAFGGVTVIRDKVKSLVSDRYYEHNYVPLENLEGEVYAVMLISHDITQSVQQMEELRKLYISDRQKDDFIKMASHELKTPVTSIKGYVQLLKSMVEAESTGQIELGPKTIKSSLSIIDKQVTKLTRLLSELLDLSRIETGRLEMKPENFNLNELVVETVQEVLYTNTKHRIQVIHDAVHQVDADRDRIGQVLVNLLVNAVKYSPDHDLVEVRVTTEHGKPAVSVRDYGIGISANDLDKIFDRFYRVEGDYEKTFPGFGIGLYIAREIITRHGGSIRVESEKDKGALFTFTLPKAGA